MKNILLEAFEFPPFSKIKNEDFKPAFEAALAEARADINKITQSKEAPNFENTVLALENSGEKLNRVSSVFFNLNSAETNDEIQKTAQEVSPWLAKFQNDLSLNEALFERVKTVYNQREGANLNPEQLRLLDRQYKSFTRNGANLPEDKKEKLRAIDEELSKLSLKFGENVLADTNGYQLHITDEKDLDGLPQSAKDTAAELAKTEGKEGFIFTLHYPSYLPFMKYVKNRELRKKLALAQGARGFSDNPYNNEEIVLKIARLRFDRAQLLGYQNHADFVLQERMAKSPQNVLDFLEDLLVKAKPAAEKEFKELEDFAKELDGIDQLQKWDSAYYSEKLQQKKFDLHEEELKPYFPLEAVLNGAFEVAGKLYGLKFEEVHDIDVYHEEVQTFKVYNEDGDYMALFYTDFHPRKGKRSGAWMTTYKEQRRKDGVNERPQVSIVCNFSRPTSTTPALLTFQEVTTLFHEFGHSLHAILANTTYQSLSGTNVFWDFVELPSQMLENWCYEEETLQLFAKHYKTGQLIPMEMVERIKKASNFLEGISTLRQLSFGFLDMSWHGIDPTKVTDVKAHEVKAFESTQQYPDAPENCMSTSFGHIFQGGYFKENGIFNRKIANKFKENVLSKGGTDDPMKLYVAFRGHEPTNEALLKRAGLLV